MIRRANSLSWHVRHARPPLGLLALGILITPLLASADPAAPTAASPPAAPDAPSNAPASEAPNAANVAEASARYSRGLALYGDGDYSLAAIEFERAYSLVPDYRLLYNVAQVRVQLGNYAKARLAFERYLRDGADKVSAERRQSVEADLKMIAARTATLRIESNIEGASVSIDDQPVGTSPFSEPILLDAGDHRIRADKPGFNAAESRLTLAGADASTVRLELTPELKVGPRIIVEKQYLDRTDHTTWIWATWSATGVFAVSGATLGAFGLQAAGNLADLRQDPHATRSQLDSSQRRARTLLTAADLLGGAAVVSGGIALYLTLSNHAEAPKSRAQTGAQVDVALAPNWVGLRGSY